MPPRTCNKTELEPGVESSSAHRPNKTLASLTVPFRKFFRPTIKPQPPHQSKETKGAESAKDEETLFDGNPSSSGPSSASIPALAQSPNLSSDAASTSKQLTSGSQVTGKTVASTFQGAHDLNISGNPHFINIGTQKMVNVYSGIYGLDTLKEFVSFDALHDSSAQDPKRRCHPGTRESVLKQMRNWVDDPNTPKRILWLHGPAGVGKSAIAQTISQSYSREKVAATFFFFRSDPARNNGNRLLPTLAWQLAIAIPDAKHYITHSLTEYPDLPRKAIEIQFEQLIAHPFRAIAQAATEENNSSRVVVVDGVDECSNTELQERFLEIVGKAVADNRMPLRFLICSRPEAHIKETLDSFRSMTLQLDLARIDEAHHDIKKYLTAEFTRIATKQEIDPESWPGQSVIDQFVSRSSGQFVYASTIIKFVGDDFNSATSQLDIILGLKPSNGEMPFAELDALYMEILQRQRHQKILNDFLAVLVARTTLPGPLYKDDALLLDVTEKELKRKLRGMHSVLKFEPGIDVHHQSFLDFLQEPSRSSQYHVNKRSAARRYLELITDSLVRYTSKVMKNIEYHESEHFAPTFGAMIRTFPRQIVLPLEDWEEVLQPLLIGVQEEMLASPTSGSSWKRGFCDDCSIFYVIDALFLHLMFFRGASRSIPPAVSPTPQSSDSTFFPVAGMQGNSEKDLDGCLTALLAELRCWKSGLPLSVAAISLANALLNFNHVQTASKIRSISDAQNLVDLFYATIRTNQGQQNQDWSYHAARLVLEIYPRISLLPQSLFLNKTDIKVDTNGKKKYRGMVVDVFSSGSYGISPMCQNAIVRGTLSHESIAPFLGIYEDENRDFAFVWLRGECGTLSEWRQRSNLSPPELLERMLEVAKAIQYMHSLSIVANSSALDSDFIFIGQNSHAMVLFSGLYLQYIRETPSKHRDSFHGSTYSFEHNIYQFGHLLYEICFGSRVAPKNDHMEVRPLEPQIPDNVWQLIQQCCQEDPMSRPAMDKVVEEMESWKSSAGSD